MYIVCKPLPNGSAVLAPGTLVDAAGWRNRAALERQRYIRRAASTELPDPVRRGMRKGGNSDAEPTDAR